MKISLICLIAVAYALLMPAQDKNTIILDENSGKPMAVGFSSREVFSDTSFSWWFDSEYENYTVDSAALESIQYIPEDVAMTVIMGTWCSDSRREVPRFYKILDYLKYPSDDITLIAVDRDKKGLEGEVTDLNIEFVPTIIFFSGEEEIGRIIETPEESLETDLVNILTE
jgi:hypothetical protein